MRAMTGPEIQEAYGRALDAHKAGDLDSAIRGYGAIIEANPKVAEAHFQAGRIYAAKNRFDRAFLHFRAAVSLRPAEGAIWNAWAEAVALGADAATEAEFLKALKAAPVPAAARVALQDRFGAQRGGTRPATGGMTPAEIRRLLSLIQSGRMAEAERLAGAALKQHPGSALALNILATALARQGKAAPAEAAFRRTIAVDPGYAEAHDNLGHFLIEQGRPDEAEAMFRRAVTLAPGLAPALVNLATCLTAAGQPADARARAGPRRRRSAWRLATPIRG